MELFPFIWFALFLVALVGLAVFRPSRHVTWLVIVLLLAAFAVWASLPTNPGICINLNRDPACEIERPVRVRQGLDLAGGLRVLMEADLPEGEDLPPGAMNEVRRIVDSRIDALGALEPVVQLQGEDRLIVELPGIDDQASAIDLIRETALLEFVDFGYNPPLEGSAILTDYEGRINTPSEDVTAEPSAEATGEPTAEATGEPTVEPGGQAGADQGPVYHTVMTGSVLRTADMSADPNGEPMVMFTLTPEGREVFAEYTTAHTGQYLGIVLDGILISAPQIQDPITAGTGSITGNFTLEEASTLATQLRYGALPVPLTVQSTETVGPTLGQISIEQSIRAGIIGIAVVLLFMLIYYRLPGVAAALALLVFAIFNFALYKLIPITLTLPAITGFLISIGTAVDGNILIFERIKEELRNGKRLEPAIRSGFDRAWTAISTSNLSTIIICMVLYVFGTSFGAGAVRGFAVTLAMGLVVNLFTAVTVTRTFLHFILLPVSDETVARRGWLLGLPRGS